MQPKSIASNKPWASDGTSPSGAHGSKLESPSYHPLLPDNPTDAPGFFIRKSPDLSEKTSAKPGTLTAQIASFKDEGSPKQMP